MEKFKLRHCKKCVTPSTRPNIDFDSLGICSACNNQKKKRYYQLGSKIKRIEENIKQS